MLSPSHARRIVRRDVKREWPNALDVNTLPLVVTVNRCRGRTSNRSSVLTFTAKRRLDRDIPASSFDPAGNLSFVLGLTLRKTTLTSNWHTAVLLAHNPRLIQSASVIPGF